MKKDKAWYWRTRRSRAQKNFVYLRVTVPGEEELGKWLARRARALMDKVSRFYDRNLSLSLVSDAEIRRINAEWREKDEHTDVISFPLMIPVDSLGDVIVSLETARRQAKEGGWQLEKELDRLLAHGLAHCAGHVHDTPYEALRMAYCERDMLGDFGMVGDTYIKQWGTTERFVALAERQRLRIRANEEKQRRLWKARRARQRRRKLQALERPAKKRVSLPEEKR